MAWRGVARKSGQSVSKAKSIDSPTNKAHKHKHKHKINHYPEKCFNHRRIDPCAGRLMCAVCAVCARYDCTVIIFRWNASTHSLITDKFQLESVNICERRKLWAKDQDRTKKTDVIVFDCLTWAPSFHLCTLRYCAAADATAVCSIAVHHKTVHRFVVCILYCKIYPRK